MFVYIQTHKTQIIIKKLLASVLSPLHKGFLWAVGKEESLELYEKHYLKCSDVLDVE